MLTVTITAWAERTYQKQKYCVKLIAAREEVSLKRIEAVLDIKHRKKNNVMLSGDISFSYPYDKLAIAKLADEKFRKTLNFMKGDNWVLIFSRFKYPASVTLIRILLYLRQTYMLHFSYHCRENNFGVGKGVWFKNGKFHIHKIDGEIISYPIEKVVFASSSNLEDHKHMETLRTLVKSTLRTVTCSTVEEMFALVSSAPHVVTDRYHPGVASMIVGEPTIALLAIQHFISESLFLYLPGTKLSLTRYALEATKMHGLLGMQQFTRKQILGMNEKAFKALLEVILKAHRVVSPPSQLASSPLDYEWQQKSV